MYAIEKSVIKVNQIKSLLYSIESAGIEARTESNLQNESFQQMTDLFYILMEQVDELANCLSDVESNKRVCDAVYAVNHAKEIEAENKRLHNVLKSVI